MALYAALTVFENTQSAASTSLGVATNGSTGQVFQTLSPAVTIAGTSCISTVTMPATGLNQKPKTYYSASTVAALVALMV
jgi:hypothetical protein